MGEEKTEKEKESESSKEEKMVQAKAESSNKDDSKKAKAKAPTNNNATTPTIATDPRRRGRKKVSMGQFLLHLSMAITALSSVVIAVFFQQPVAWAMYTTGSLGGEIQIDSPEVAKSFADFSIEEATDLWSEPTSNWHTMFNNTRLAKNQLTVECRRISEGPYKDSEVHLARAQGLVRGVTPRQAFDFMSSPEGLALLAGSIISNNGQTDFYQSIEGIAPDWREGQGKIEIAEFQISGFGPFVDRHFLVQSSSIPKEAIFVAKSVLHSSRPGSSTMYNLGEDKEEKGKDTTNNNDKRVRSIISFGFQVNAKTLEEEKGGEEEEEVVVIKMISYVNFFLHESIMSFASCKWLFPDLYEDLQVAFDAKQHIK